MLCLSVGDMASWKTEHRAQPVQSWTFREVFSGLVGNESTCIPKAVVAPSVVSTPPSVGKRTGAECCVHLSIRGCSQGTVCTPPAGFVNERV